MADERRPYPHVDEIQDWPTNATVRLLWDRIHELEGRLATQQTSIDAQATRITTTQTNVDAVARDARSALALSQRPGQPADSETGGGGGGSTPPDGGDGGGASEGCSGAGPSGHDSGGLLTPVRAGQIVCGTGQEWIALRNPTPDLATREAQAEELIRRMIWHLRLAGFTAGRQNNSTRGLRLSKDKLCVVVNGVLRVYDVFKDLSDYTIQMGIRMGETSPARMIDDDGIPD